MMYFEMTGEQLKKNWEDFLDSKMKAPEEETRKYMAVWGECDGLIFDVEEVCKDWLNKVCEGDTSPYVRANDYGWHLTGRLSYNREVPEWLTKKIKVSWPGYNKVRVEPVD